jgi:hypothetical protein
MAGVILLSLILLVCKITRRCPLWEMGYLYWPCKFIRMEGMTNIKILLLAIAYALVLHPKITRWQQKRRAFYDNLWRKK